MTVQNVPTEKRYAANGVSPSYTIPFLLIEAGDLDVYLNGVEVTTGFSITGVGNPTSTVTFVPPYPAGDLYLVLNVPFQRLVDYQENGDFLAGTVNRDYDRIWQALKQLLRTTSRSPVLGFNDIDGEGFYRAKGNGLTGLASAGGVMDAATNWKDVLDYVASILATGQGPINNAANVVYVFPNGVARTVQDLANSADPLKGSHGIGHYTSGGNALSVADLLNTKLNIRTFGPVVDDGVTNNIATFQAAALAPLGSTIVVDGLKNCLVTGTVNVRDGQCWDFTGSKIITGNTNAVDLFSIVGRIGCTLIKPNIKGSGGVAGAAGTAGAIHVENSSNWRIEQPVIDGMPGYGLFFTPDTGTLGRGPRGSVESPVVTGCNIGIRDIAGTGAEYFTITNAQVSKCLETNIDTSAGNVLWLGGHCIDGIKDGLVVRGGANHAHGLICNMNINHNPRYNIYTQQVLNGQSFIGCHIYANNNAGAGAIFLDRSKGIYFDGGHLDCWIYNDADANSSTNIFKNMYCPGSYGAITLSSGPNPGNFYLWFKDCYGPGSITGGKTINDPGHMYVSAKRAAGSTQSVPSGTPTQLVWPIEDYDRRLAYNAATGLFSVLTGYDGNYRITGLVVISGSSLTAASSYLELRKNGANQTFFSPAAFSTTKMSIAFNWQIDLVAGDTISLHMTAFGTTPLFGDSSYASSLVIEKVA